MDVIRSSRRRFLGARAGRDAGPGPGPGRPGRRRRGGAVHRRPYPPGDDLEWRPAADGRRPAAVDGRPQRRQGRRPPAGLARVVELPEPHRAGPRRRQGPPRPAHPVLLHRPAHLLPRRPRRPARHAPPVRRPGGQGVRRAQGRPADRRPPDDGPLRGLRGPAAPRPLPQRRAARDRRPRPAGTRPGAGRLPEGRLHRPRPRLLGVDLGRGRGRRTWAATRRGRSPPAGRWTGSSTPTPTSGATSRPARGPAPWPATGRSGGRSWSAAPIACCSAPTT